MRISLDEKLLDELACLESRLIEDRLYQIAILEIEAEQFDQVAQAKAFEEAEGDTKKARAFYTKHRVQRLQDIIAQYVAVKSAEIQEEAQKNRKASRVEVNERVRSFLGGLVPKRKTKTLKPVAVYKGQPIYKFHDGFKSMGAWFRSVDQAKSYIDNNPNLRS